MSVFRIEKTKNYTVMSNHHLKDINLSYRAKGLLSFMLSLPDDWDYSVNGLAKISKESVKAIRTILKELEEFCYLERKRIQLENGRFDYDYCIYEEPYTQKGHAVEGYAVDGTQINTNIQNTKYKDKIDKQINSIVKELINKQFINESDLEIYYYNELFNCLISIYGYEKVIIVTNYILKRWTENKGLDEEGNKIINKYGYFKSALENNLIKISSDVDLEWE